MHWWRLPCESCNGGGVSRLFCRIYTGYTDADCNMDCVVVVAGGGGGCLPAMSGAIYSTCTGGG